MCVPRASAIVDRLAHRGRLSSIVLITGDRKSSTVGAARDAELMKLVLILSLSSAFAYGLSDFLGGVLTRRAGVWAVAAASQATAALLAAAVVPSVGGEPGTGALLWGVFGGFGSAAGNVFIYRGLAAGRMTVVAPLSAITAAALPIVVGLLAGERPSLLQGIGVVSALPAIFLVSSTGGPGEARRSDVGVGVLAGLGFGVQFSALGQVPPDAGLLPLAVSQAVSVALIVGTALAISASWMPRDRFGALATVAGALAGIATICFQLAVQQGLLTIASVLASLYPAVTVLLAALVLREGIRRPQGIGLLLAAGAIGLIAAG
jgi:uncharacterized membrane protein